MSPKRWIILLIFYISYLMFGASIYYHIEHSEEKVQRADNLKKRIKITEYLLAQLSSKNASMQQEILSRISDYCGRPVTDYRDDEYELPFTWTFYHSIFFAFTVCSTVGYGNISPTTTLGRMIMIVYSVIGIPVNSILFAGLADYFGRIFRAIYHRYKKYKMSNDIHYVPPQLSLITTVVIALIPGITVFLVIPSWIFSYFEDWPFTLAFYYSYVTTTTIGFGDYVPTFQPHQHREFGNWFVVYQIFIIVWFIFSLGYFLMIMTFITRGLQSKKLEKLEHQLSANIRATQHRIWSGVTKDVSYLRKIFNELYFIKFKPVYTELNDKHCMFRSISCPELTIYNTEWAAINRPQYRQRTFSQCSDLLDTSIHGLNKITPSAEIVKYSFSDTELNKIDRQKSFETVEAFRQTTQLLVKVVNALSAIKPPTTPLNDENNPYPWNSFGAQSQTADGGYHGLSDSQILASEWLSNSNTNSNEVPVKRNRASSDFNLSPKLSKLSRGLQRGVGMHNEWTWSGDNNQIQEEINIRYRQDNEQIVAIGEQSSAISTIANDEPKLQRARKFTLPESFRRLFDFRKRSSQVYDLPFTTANSNNWATNLQQQQLREQQTNRKYSVVSVPEAICHQVPNLSYYSTVTANASPTYFRSEKNQSQTHSSKSFGTRLSSMSTTSPFSLGKGYRALDNSNDSKFMPTSTSFHQQHPPLINNYAGNELRSLAAFNSCRQRAIQELAADKEFIESLPTDPISISNRDATDVTRPFSESRACGRRSSWTSLTHSQDHLDLLEKTTLADVIRALELVHTRVNLNTMPDEVADRNFKERVNIDSKQQQPFPYRLAIDSSLIGQFPDDSSKTFTANSASLLNRTYLRRSTLLDLPSFGGSKKRLPLNILNRRQQQQPVATNLCPDVNPNAQRNSMPTSSFRFKRRFSIRPTALQIPPGKAPRPSTILPSSSLESNQSLSVPSTPTLPTMVAHQSPQPQIQSQQKYFTPRPSPLAQPTNISSGDERKTERSTSSGSNTPTAVSSYSPLTRLVQITQAQKQSDKKGAEAEYNYLP